MEFEAGEIVCLFSNNPSSLWTCRRVEGHFVHQNVRCHLEAKVPSFGYVCEVDSAFVVMMMIIRKEPVFLRLWKDSPFIFKINQVDGVMENQQGIKRWVPGCLD